jgi:hypothetical protein
LSDLIENETVSADFCEILHKFNQNGFIRFPVFSHVRTGRATLQALTAQRCKRSDQKGSGGSRPAVLNAVEYVDRDIGAALLWAQVGEAQD